MKWNKALLLLLLPIFFISCQKEIKTAEQSRSLGNTAARNNSYNGHLTQTNTYSSEVAIKWLSMQIRLMSTSGLSNLILGRPYAYSGIALYESVVPGMPAYQSIAPQLNALPALPPTVPGFAYHWPSSANAALAFMTRRMFPNSPAADKARIDSLENALNVKYQNEADTAVINRSIEYGRGVAKIVFDWAETDGYLHSNDPYTPPVGDGLWVPTPPAFAKQPAGPYWGNVRTIVPGSVDGTQPGPPISYSTDPTSGFYNMVKYLYDVSQTLTSNQKAQALFWKDASPGGSVPGHWESILMQVLQMENPTLDKAAVAFALSGIALNDANIGCWKTKYQYNLVRPVTYVRNVLGHTTWSPVFNTPAHPEYASAHAVLSAAVAEALANLFGDNYNFTDHSYDNLGFTPRSFNSFQAAAKDASDSRLLAGIHYQPSCDSGLIQGRNVAQKIIGKLKFLKE